MSTATTTTLQLVGLEPTANIGTALTCSDLGTSRLIAKETAGTGTLDAAKAKALGLSLRRCTSDPNFAPPGREPTLETIKTLAEFFVHCGGFAALCDLCSEPHAKASVVHVTDDYAVALCSTCDGLDGPEGIAIQPADSAYGSDREATLNARVDELGALEVKPRVYAWEMNAGTDQSFFVAARAEDVLITVRGRDGWLIWPNKPGTDEPDNRSHYLERWWTPFHRSTYRCECGAVPRKPGVNYRRTPHCKGKNTTLITLELPSGKVVEV